jgi:hypothetical protein
VTAAGGRLQELEQRAATLEAALLDMGRRLALVQLQVYELAQFGQVLTLTMPELQVDPPAEERKPD